VTWSEARTHAEALAHTTIGWIALQRNENETAAKEFTKVLRIAPNASSANGWPIDTAQVSAWLAAATARGGRIRQVRAER
jgi:hypothetical protein